MARSKIHIKAANKGKLTREMGGNITEAKLKKAEKSGSKALRKRAQFADNARKWKH